MNPASTTVARFSGFGNKITIEMSSVLKSSVTLAWRFRCRARTPSHLINVAITEPDCRLRGRRAGATFTVMKGEVETYRQNRLLAMRAPSASAANFAQTMSGSTAA
jgi:hypothetical protein